MAITLKEHFALKSKVIVEVKPEISSIKKLEHQIKRYNKKNKAKHQKNSKIKPL
ncbi:hypothetical protein [Macrococcus bovicus]|uniref:hypothetical protein n=1 Tax=Macrococcus bovicus TaxID=69968 RepID=UPI001409C695|nr:hypothetical protein [Macrococcus bovicus]